MRDRVAADKKELVQRFRTEGILDAARRVIARRGLEKATMEQFASEAGISKATIYLYFKNKESIYFHCVIDRFDELIKVLKQSIEGMDDPMQKIETLIRAHMKEMESDMDFFRVFFTESRGMFLDHSTEFGQEFAKRQQEFSSLMSGTLKECMDKGILREMDPVKGYSLLFSMVRGMVMCKILNCDNTPLSSDAGLVLDVFCNGVKLK